MIYPCRHIVACAILLCAVLATGTLPGQSKPAIDSVKSEQRPIVSSIAFIGNEVTEADILLREMTLRRGDVITAEAVDESRSRLYNLGLFNTVEITYPPLDSTVLIVEVTERWYLWPVPLVGIVHHDWSNWYYGAGIQHWNVRGRNERIFAGGVFGYNPWASVAYSNPWIGGDMQIFTNTEIKMQRFENKNILARGDLPDFDENHFSVSQLVGKRLDLYRSVWSRFGFQYVHVTDPRANLTASRDGFDRTWYFGLGATHDSRDYIQYPMSGVNSTISVLKKGLGIGKVDYLSYSADARYYQPVFAGSSIGLRVFARVVTGPAVPEYDNVFFGFGERIRGRFNQRYEGQNILGANLEYRFPLLEPTLLHFGFVPMKQFQDWRFGLYAAAFIDAGTVWEKSGRPEWESPPSGYGAGLHFLLPYGFVLRLEYAVSNLGRSEFIYDMGVSF